MNWAELCCLSILYRSPKHSFSPSSHPYTKLLPVRGLREINALDYLRSRLQMETYNPQI